MRLNRSTHAELAEEAVQAEHDFHAAHQRIAMEGSDEAWRAMYQAADRSVKAKRRAERAR